MKTLRLVVSGEDARDDHVLASELRRQLIDAGFDGEATIEPTDGSRQDAGSTIVLVLGAPAVVTVAAGLKAWMVKRYGASVRIYADGGIHLKGFTPDKALDALKAALDGGAADTDDDEAAT